MDWQPIETAPKDGTKFIALFVWDEGYFAETAELDGDDLISCITGRYASIFPGLKANHWMPLPEPPK